jgi:hypothetical protein
VSCQVAVGSYTSTRGGQRSGPVVPFFSPPARRDGHFILRRIRPPLATMLRSVFTPNKRCGTSNFPDTKLPSAGNRLVTCYKTKLENAQQLGVSNSTHVGAREQLRHPFFISPKVTQNSGAAHTKLGILTSCARSPARFPKILGRGCSKNIFRKFCVKPCMES